MQYTAMPSNVEIKARLVNREAALQVAKQLSNSDGTTLEQEDTFFKAPNGRLKLRVESGKPTAQLISYSRSDTSGPKLSSYHIAPVQDPEKLKVVLSEAMGVLGCVKKSRLLFLVGQTRIHIDHVDSLGHFLELEVVMREGQALREGGEIASDLMKKLGISDQHLVTGAYMDLILKSS